LCNEGKNSSFLVDFVTTFGDSKNQFNEFSIVLCEVLSAKIVRLPSLVNLIEIVAIILVIEMTRCSYLNLTELVEQEAAQ
jgi:hypothetical protein